jgi:general secretion pathway protein D
MAKNGETVAMGGLIQEDSLFIRSKIPFLGDIPGLGWLFKSDTTQQNKLNLLLFLTPTIVKDSSQMNRLVEINKSRSELLKKEQLPDKDKPEIDW